MGLTGLKICLAALAFGWFYAASGCAPKLSEDEKNIADLKLQLQSNPQDMAAHYQLGLLLRSEGQYDEAQSHMQATLLDAKGRVADEQSALLAPRNLYPSQEGLYEFRFPYTAAVKSHEIKSAGNVPQQHLEEGIEWLDRVS